MILELNCRLRGSVGSPMRIGMSALIRGKGYAYWGYAFAVVLMES